MPRTETEEIQRVHLWLYARDVERINELFGKNIGISRAIRMMVRKFLNQIDAKAQLEAKPIGDIEDVEPNS